ncbi:MAG: acyl dehydratase [Myxococcota bacterium]|jgi:acyl dehydratase
MSVPMKYVLEQGPVLAGLGRTAIEAIKQQMGASKPTGVPQLPGPEITTILPPRSKGLISTYVRHVGGDPRAYKNEVPAHLFPQWSFGLASQALAGLPYPLVKAVNGGCTIVQHHPLPTGQPLHVSVRLENIDDNGRRAIMQTRVITGTAEIPNAIEASLFALVPLKQPGGSGKSKRERPRVPQGAKEIDWWRLKPDAGLDFAKLTGDFNPLHWIPAYAKASGFRSVILHGFSTMARAWEGLGRQHLARSRRITAFNVRFTRPLVLPARVGLYTQGDEVIVGDAPGGPAYMTGTFETSPL